MGVAAAETTTKSVEWTGGDAVIKVDLGEKLIVTAPTASVQLETVSENCSNGKDANGDGYVDSTIYAMHPETNEDQGWMYTDAKYWPSERTAMYYIGLTAGDGKVTGGRFLAPGAEENEGTWYNQLSHKAYTTEEDVFNALKDGGSIKVSYTEDGDIAYVDVITIPYYYTTNYDHVMYYVTLRLTSKGQRKSDDAIIEDVVAYYAEGKALNTNNYYTAQFKRIDTAARANTSAVSYDIDVKGDGSDVVSLSAGDIILVSQNRKGEYTFEGIAHSSTKFVETATASELSFSQLEDKKEYVITKADGTVISSAFGKAHVATLKQDSANIAFAEELPYRYLTGSESGVGTTTFDAIYYSLKSDTAYSAVACDGTSGVLTVKDITVVSATGKLVAAKDTDLTVANLNNGKLFYQDYNLANVAVATPLIDAEYDYVGDEDGDDNYEGYYTASVNNGADYFYLTNEAAAGKYVPYTIAMTDSSRIYLRGERALAHEPANATGTYGDYNAVTALAVSGKIAVVDITDVDGIQTGADHKVNNWGYAGIDTDDNGVDDKWVIDGYPTRIATVTLDKVGCYEKKQTAVFNFDTLTFDYDDAVATLAGTGSLGTADAYLYGATTAASANAATFDASVNKHVNGIYYLETPENDSDYYVLYTGETSELDLDYSVNTRTETVSAKAADGKTELSAKAVRLDGVWYPAFETEEELIDFVVAIAGIEALEGNSTDVTSDFYEWYKSAVADTKNPLMGSNVYGKTMPTDSISDVAHAKACEYTATSSADASKVTVTSNASEINTSEAGVYDLVWTASYNGEALEDTHTVKVVVAPNYTREWKNGKVVKLTSYYVNEPTAKYAEYNYDWDNKKATVTYYNVDGSVNDTATIEL